MCVHMGIHVCEKKGGYTTDTIQDNPLSVPIVSSKELSRKQIICKTLIFLILCFMFGVKLTF